MNRANAIACRACGAGIVVERLDASVRCTHCGNVQATAERGALAQYEGNVGLALAGAAREQQQAASWASMAVAEPPRIIGQLKIVVGVLFVLIIAVPMAAQALGDSDRMMPMNEQLAFCGMVVACFVAFVVLLTIGASYRNRVVSTASPGVVVASCPHCGGGNALGVGQTLERCVHCGAMLVPSHTIMADGEAAAVGAHRRAALERFRAERAMMLGITRISAATSIPYILAGHLCMLALCAAVAGTAGAGREHLPVLTACVLWLVFFASVGLVVAIFKRRQFLRERGAWVLAAASGPFAGRPLPDAASFVAWLDAHWAGPTPLQEMTVGPCFKGSAHVIEHFMVAMALNPVAFARQYPGYASVHLAAWIPALHGGAPFDRARLLGCQQELWRYGFRLEVEAGGLRALAEGSDARRLAVSADGGERLGSVVRGLLGLAMSLGAVPM